MQAIIEKITDATVKRGGVDKAVKIVTMNGEQYEVLDYVVNRGYLAKCAVGGACEATIRQGMTGDEAGIKFITKISPVNGAEKPKTPKPEAKKDLRHLVGVFLRSDGVNATIEVRGEKKLYCLSPGMAEGFKDLPPRQIIFDIDKSSYIVSYELGAEVDVETDTVKTELPEVEEVKPEPEKKPEPERKPKETKEKTEKVPPKAEVSKSLSYDVKPETTKSSRAEPMILMQYQRERLVGLEACAKISAQAYSMSVHSPETHLEVLNKIAEGAEYLLDVLTDKAMK